MAFYSDSLSVIVARRESHIAVSLSASRVNSARVSRRNLTMRSSGPRGGASMFPDVLSARGRLTRR